MPGDLPEDQLQHWQPGKCGSAMEMIWQAPFVHLLPIVELLDFVQALESPGEEVWSLVSVRKVYRDLWHAMSLTVRCFLTQCPDLTQVLLYLIRLRKFPIRKQ